MLDRSDRGHVAWDIETTGFGWSAEITVVGFWYPGGHATLVVNAGPHAVDAGTFEKSLADASRATVRVCIADDEAELLGKMGGRKSSSGSTASTTGSSPTTRTRGRVGSTFRSSARGVFDRTETGCSTASCSPNSGSRSKSD